MQTPEGKAFLEVNGDGLREVDRTDVLRRPRRIAVIGDSFVEGWWVSNHQTISANLNELMTDSYFINGGLRSTGALMQAARLRSVLSVYRPSEVVWLVNDTDILDDRFSCAVAQNSSAPLSELQFGVPEFQLSGWRELVVRAAGATALASRLRRRFYQEKWIELALGEGGKRCGLCRGVAEMKKAADEAKLRLRVFYVPLNPAVEIPGFAGIEAKGELLGCLAAHGLEVRELGSGLAQNLYWENDIHLRPEGLALLAEEMAETLR